MVAKVALAAIPPWRRRPQSLDKGPARHTIPPAGHIASAEAPDVAEAKARFLPAYSRRSVRKSRHPLAQNSCRRGIEQKSHGR